MTPDINICICTFKRPQIRETLESLANMNGNGKSIHIIIADNDETNEAQQNIENWCKELNLSTTYVHAPARNISIARNACLDHVTAPIAVFIDDDETVTHNWLTELLKTYEQTKAAAILGPVKAIYEPTAPKWMSEKDFHSIEPVFVDDKIITGYTSNLLINQTKPPVKDLRFKEELGTSGGEDSDYLARLINLGETIEYAEKAIVTEKVPKNRAKYTWLAKRRFRMGQTHAMMQMQGAVTTPAQKLKAVTITAAKALYCFAFALLNIFNKGKLAFWSLRGILHIGAIFKYCGKKELKQYG